MLMESLKSLSGYPKSGLLRQFVTVHRISTDDGRSEILLDDPRKAIALVNQRDRLNQQWLDRAFKIAAKQDTKALVVATQLDPFTPAGKNETPSPIALLIRPMPASANKLKACPRALANRCCSCTETPRLLPGQALRQRPKHLASQCTGRFQGGGRRHHQGGSR